MCRDMVAAVAAFGYWLLSLALAGAEQPADPPGTLIAAGPPRTTPTSVSTDPHGLDALSVAASAAVDGDASARPADRLPETPGSGGPHGLAARLRRHVSGSLGRVFPGPTTAGSARPAGIALRVEASPLEHEVATTEPAERAALAGEAGR